MFQVCQPFSQIYQECHVLLFDAVIIIYQMLQMYGFTNGVTGPVMIVQKLLGHLQAREVTSPFTSTSLHPLFESIIIFYLFIFLLI